MSTCRNLPPLGPLQEWVGSDDRTHAHAGGREMGPKEPNEIDRLVGSRVRQRRMQLGVSQEQLAAALGITVPQVQKYEKGVNRIGASRLHKIAGLLGVPIGAFFEAHAGAQASGPEMGGAEAGAAEPGQPDPSVFADRETIALALAFSRITRPQRRRALLELARAVARLETGALKRAQGRPSTTVAVWTEQELETVLASRERPA